MKKINVKLNVIKPDLKNFCKMELFCNIVLKDNIKLIKNKFENNLKLHNLN